MRFLRWGCGMVAVVSAALLLARAVHGPFRWMHSPLTAECAIAVSVLVSWLATARSDRQPGVPDARRWLGLPAIFVASVLPFIPALSLPLITDDYTHIRQIKLAEAPRPLGCLTHACGGWGMFRPLGFATYWAEWGLWGTRALPRHAFDVLLHAATGVLFLLLVRRLGVAPPADFLAALLFAWNGIWPETVAWSGARFDSLATLFSLASAVAALNGGGVGFSLSLLATGAACLSKESAYVLPVLIGLLLGKRSFTRSGRILVASNLAVACGIFAWRWWAVHGIGGYSGADPATPEVLQFSSVALAKTFLARIWGVPAFPLNWSRLLEWWMKLGLGVGVAAFLLLLRSRPDRRRIALCVAGVAVACVPVQNRLLIDPSLERARYLDLAAVAFTLLLVFGSLALPRRVAITVLVLLVAFHLAALEHNLRIWSDVSKARYELCRTVADRARHEPAPITINDVPLIVDGVYWRNGLENCAFLEFGIPPGTIQVH